MKAEHRELFVLITVLLLLLLQRSSLDLERRECIYSSYCGMIRFVLLLLSANGKKIIRFVCVEKGKKVCFKCLFHRNNSNEVYKIKQSNRSTHREHREARKFAIKMLLPVSSTNSTI